MPAGVLSVKLGPMTHGRRLLLGSVAALLLGAGVVYLLTELRVFLWPERTRLVYSKGALFDYLAARCIAPLSVAYVGEGGAVKVAGSWVGAYSGQAVLTHWRIRGRSGDYPVAVSIFPDAEFAVTWWYDTADATKSNSFVSSRVWADPPETERSPIDKEILVSSDMPGAVDCDSMH